MMLLILTANLVAILTFITLINFIIIDDISVLYEKIPLILSVTGFYFGIFQLLNG